jgi:hypothetical protein
MSGSGRRSARLDATLPETSAASTPRTAAAMPRRCQRRQGTRRPPATAPAGAPAGSTAGQRTAGRCRSRCRKAAASGLAACSRRRRKKPPIRRRARTVENKLRWPAQRRARQAGAAIDSTIAKPASAKPALRQIGCDSEKSARLGPDPVNAQPRSSGLLPPAQCPTTQCARRFCASRRRAFTSVPLARLAPTVRLTRAILPRVVSVAAGDRAIPTPRGSDGVAAEVGRQVRAFGIAISIRSIRSIRAIAATVVGSTGRHATIAVEIQAASAAVASFGGRDHRHRGRRSSGNQQGEASHLVVPPGSPPDEPRNNRHQR